MIMRRFGLYAAASVLASGALAAFGQAAAQLPSDLDPASLARLPYLQRKDADDSAKRLFDIFDRSKGSSPDDTLSGPLAFAAYNVPVANATPYSWTRVNASKTYATGMLHSSAALPTSAAIMTCRLLPRRSTQAPA